MSDDELVASYVPLRYLLVESLPVAFCLFLLLAIVASLEFSPLDPNFFTIHLNFLSSAFLAHEDRHIRFFDNGSGKMIHSMVAHLDAVTSLAVDPNGLYLLSGSHDCSIRLWNLDSKTCVQVSWSKAAEDLRQ